MPADTRYAWNNYCGKVLNYASGFLFLVFFGHVCTEVVTINTVCIVKMLPESICWLLECYFL